MLATEVRTGDAPKPAFSTKTYENLKKNPEINPPSTIEISPYFWVCILFKSSIIELQIATFVSTSPGASAMSDPKAQPFASKPASSGSRAPKAAANPRKAIRMVQAQDMVEY